MKSVECRVYEGCVVQGVRRVCGAGCTKGVWCRVYADPGDAVRLGAPSARGKSAGDER